MTEQISLAPQATLMAWLRLMRLPTVFTALANVLCGFFISSAERNPAVVLVQPWFWLLLLASAGLYLGGMVLNDVFDAALDAKERPERPIPSGKITRTQAAIFGGFLMGSGITAAWFAGKSAQSGLASFYISIILAAAVLLYDSILKNTLAAPLGMGACRFLNIILGASCCGSIDAVFSNPQLSVALALGIYVIGVTWFARHEAGNASRNGLRTGLGIAIAGIGVNVWVAANTSTDSGTGAIIALVLIAANVAFRCLKAISANHPVLLQKTVGFMLLNIVFMDAAMTFAITGSGRLATMVVILVIPATLMKRFIPLS